MTEFAGQPASWEEALDRIQSKFWGTKIDVNGTNYDTGVNEFAVELVNALKHVFTRLTLNAPMTLINNTDGPALRIVNQGDRDKDFIEMKNESGEAIDIGVGLRTKGVLANNLVPAPQFRLNPEDVNAVYSTNFDGAGNNQDNASDQQTGYGGNYGSGNYEDTGDVTTWYPSPWIDINFYNPTIPPQCVTVSDVQDDVLEVTRGSETFYVAKPPNLQKTPFHNQTVNGITYDYEANPPGAGSQTREADNGSTTEEQEIVPQYSVGDKLTIIKVGNGTGATTDAGYDTYWQDLNVDGRTWVKTPDGC